MNKLTCFDLSINDHIAHLVLNRPHALNTLDLTFWRELDAVLHDLHQGNQARVLVISSMGKHFSAGMSLEVFGSTVAMDDQSAEGRAAIADMLAGLQSTFTRIENLRIPVIAVLQGGCIGGAVDMVTAACLRYASADAFFCIQEINIGMVADVGTLQRLPKLMPMAVVKELAYTGKRMGADKALQYGLVNDVLPDPASALAAAMQAAKEIASKPPVAIWGTKQALHYARDHSTEDALKQMGWLQSGIWSNAHVKEAINAFQAKRSAQFPDLAPLKSFND
jgi:enoyl-CoA hydratase